MRDSLQRSIDRAAALLGTAPRSDNYISVKLAPADASCCCFHCWPSTWNAVNRQYARQEPMKDEGDLLVESETGTRLVLECHESGPEIVAYVGAAVGLATAITQLVLFLLKARQRERKPCDSISMTLRRAARVGAVEEEESLDVSLPLNDAAEKLIAEVIRRHVGESPQHELDPPRGFDEREGENADEQSRNARFPSCQ